MKKKKGLKASELRREYDFAKLKGGARGKYVSRYRSGTNLVLLEPDVAKVFRDSASVNEALRVIAKAARRGKAA